MDNQKTKELIEELQKKLLPKQHLNEESTNYISEYYFSHISGIWEKDTAPHYHFQIDASSDEEGRIIADAIIKTLSNQGNYSKYFVCTEKELLENPNLLLTENKNTSFVITDFRNAELTVQEQSAWEQLAEIAFRPQCPVLFLIASGQAFNSRFTDSTLHEILYYQTFLYKIHSEFGEEYYLNSLIQYLDQLYPDKIQKTFRPAMRAYIQTVLPSAIKQNEDFLNDLKRRVQSQYIQNCFSKQPSVIDETCVPFYQIHHFNQPTTGNFFKQQPDFSNSSTNDVKNVLLLTLSTPNFRRQRVKLFDGNDGITDYYYQLEPVPYMLIRKFEKEFQQNGQQLDGIIMICSQKTLTESGFGQNEAFTPKAFWATAHDYFVCQTFDYAKKYQKTPLSFHKIETYCTKENRPFRSEEILSSVIGTIRTLHKWYKNLNIYVDIHGGLRADQEILNTSLSLLQMEGIPINQKNIYTLEVTSQSSNAVNLIQPAGEVMNIMNFAYGIHESITYGQTKSLQGLNYENPSEHNTLENMRTIAEGIQLCDVKKFENGLTSLNDSLKNLDQESEKGYLTLFKDLIHDNYGDILLCSNPSNPNTIQKIQWCMDKGFFQQALTILESKMPTEIIKNGFLVSQASDRQPALFTDHHEIVPEIRKKLQDNGIPQHEDGCLENVIVYKTEYIRGKRDGSDTTYLDFDELPTADNILEKLPPYYVSGPYGSSNTAPKKPLQIMLSGFPVTDDQTKLKTQNKTKVKFYYIVYENEKASHEINVLLRLYLQLKKERNATNHAGSNKSRNSLDTIKNALECYIRLYNRILVILHA